MPVSGVIWAKVPQTKDSFLAYRVSGVRDLVTFRKIILSSVCTQQKEKVSLAFKWTVVIRQGQG